MKNDTLLIALVALLIGLGIGYGLWGSNDYRSSSQNGMMSSSNMMHGMSDGSMMKGDAGMDMDQMMDSMMAGLAGKKGDEFDKAFLSEMVVHHQGAVVMAQAVLKSSKRPELLKLANDIISTQTSEINMMKGWETSWFKK